MIKENLTAARVNEALALDTTQYGPATVRLYTPTECAKYLKDFNTKNRKMKKTHVAKLELALRNGDWMITGETIKFGPDGKLLDGQHRMQACVNTGIPFHAYTVYGIETAAQKATDGGLGRNLKDALDLDNFKNTTVLAPASKLLFGFLHKVLSRGDTGFYVSIPQGLEVIDKHPGLITSVTFTGNYRFKIGGLPSASAACTHYLFSRVDKVAADQFIKDLTTGVMLGADDPVRYLREQMINTTNSPRVSNPRNHYHVAFMIKAWNARRRNKSQKKYIFRPGNSNEKFPDIDGLNIVKPKTSEELVADTLASDPSVSVYAEA